MRFQHSYAAGHFQHSFSICPYYYFFIDSERLNGASFVQYLLVYTGIANHHSSTRCSLPASYMCKCRTKTILKYRRNSIIPYMVWRSRSAVVLRGKRNKKVKRTMHGNVLHCRNSCGFDRTSYFWFCVTKWTKAPQQKIEN